MPEWERRQKGKRLALKYIKKEKYEMDQIAGASLWWTPRRATGKQREKNIPWSVFTIYTRQLIQQQKYKEKFNDFALNIKWSTNHIVGRVSKSVLFDGIF